MRLTTLVTSVLAVAVVAPPLVLPSPAGAATASAERPSSETLEDTLLDPTRYWVRDTEASDGAGATGATGAGALRAADVRRFGVTHTSTGVSALIKTASVEGVDTTATLAVRTPGRVDYLLRFERSADEQTSVELLGPTGEPVDCDEEPQGYVLDTLVRTSLVVPASCLGDPEWVRVGAGTTARAPGQRFGYADDVRVDGRAAPGRRPQLGGTRLYVGRG
jgi:hypothetical protein